MGVDVFGNDHEFVVLLGKVADYTDGLAGLEGVNVKGSGGTNEAREGFPDSGVIREFQCVGTPEFEGSHSGAGNGYGGNFSFEEDAVEVVGHGDSLLGGFEGFNAVVEGFNAVVELVDGVLAVGHEGAYVGDCIEEGLG